MGKLVRDRIPAVIRRSGHEPVVRVLGAGEYRGALVDKLFEEAAEVREAVPAKVIEEIADVYEVLRALAEAEGHDWTTVEKAAAAKRAERGAFRDRLYLE
ncbi:nucleoside triphosphate pyrophosphohydrolase [Nonomuraea typhae]|uniref:nucleoside triphosphate pyrophosphohydrolase n=1 Tax=Nonomuraea typhae TaxID=2603600 RepID=UPI0012FB31FB|nr:nucleoside triphosphate pyrophosphohydrolase [Nonomuraea typhae]